MPLSKLLRKTEKFEWGEEQEQAFEKLKEKLCSEPVLISPDLEKPFLVTTDASDYAIGAILSQGKLGQDKPCAFASRALKGSELRYPTYDKELLALVFAKEQFRPYIYGRKFTVITDHEPLKHFHTTKQVDLRFNRLKAALRGYSFDIIYRPGVKNPNADALSRNPVLEEGEENPERPRAELYLLADKQEEIENNGENDEPPARVFRTRAIRIPKAQKILMNDSSLISEDAREGKAPRLDKETDEESEEEPEKLVYRKNEFLAVRNEEGGFYLCQAKEDVYESKRSIRVRWLTQVEGRKKIYYLDYADKIDFRSILMNVRMIRMNDELKIRDDDFKAVEKQLKKSIKASEDREKESQETEGSDPIISRPRNNFDKSDSEDSEDMQRGVVTTSTPRKVSCEKSGEQDSDSSSSISIIQMENDQENNANLSRNEGQNGSPKQNESVQNRGEISKEFSEMETSKNLGEEEKSRRLDLTDKPRKRLIVDVHEGQIKGKEGIQINIWDEKEFGEKQGENFKSNGNNTTGKRTSLVKNYYRLLPDCDRELSLSEGSVVRDSTEINNDNSKEKNKTINMEISKEKTRENVSQITGENKDETAEEIDRFFEEGPNALDGGEIIEEIARSLREKYSENEVNMDITTKSSRTGYRATNTCAEPLKILERDENIPFTPPGNCLFHSLIKLKNLEITAENLRYKLLNSRYIKECRDVKEATRILSSLTEYGDENCLQIFTKEFNTNICVHFICNESKTIYCHFKANEGKDFIHLHLKELHFTPLMEGSKKNNQEKSKNSEIIDESIEKASSIATEHSQSIENRSSHCSGDKMSMTSQVSCSSDAINESVISASQDGGRRDSAMSTRASQMTHGGDSDNEDESMANQQDNSQNRTANVISEKKKLEDHRVKNIRSPRDKPPWALAEGQEPPPLTGIKKIKDHPFKFKENLVCLMTTDKFLNTEILDALIERQVIKIEEIDKDNFQIGDIKAMEFKDTKIIFVFVKKHINDKIMQIDMKKALKNLRKLIKIKQLKSVGIIKDLAILSAKEWEIFNEKFNEIFQGMTLTAVLFQNNIPIPAVEDRYKLIKEFHEATIGGHRGINKTYKKIAKDYYWKNMRPDVHQFVQGCIGCQTKKLVRIKTRLPLVISDTPRFAFEKCSMDFYGPLKESRTGNRYILTYQDWLTKFVILMPVRFANAQEVARALVEKVFSYVGPPAAIVTDQGKHFYNAVLEEFAKLFKIEKYTTTAYHPQSNGGIERMHATLAEYLKQYVKEADKWDEWTAACQHAYNCTEHEATGFSPHELVFGRKARTPSSFPRKEEIETYDKYLCELAEALGQAQTIAAMNLVQAKYRSKFYYDRKLNTKHFREGEMVYLLKEPQIGKYDVQYEGPYEIIKVYYRKNNVTIKKGNRERTVHVDKIKRACTLKAPPQQEESEKE